MIQEGPNRKSYRNFGDKQPKITFSKQKFDRPYDCPAPLLEQRKTSVCVPNHEVFFVELCKSWGLPLSSTRTLAIPCPTPIALACIWPCTSRSKKYIACKTNLPYAVVRLRINPRRFENLTRLGEKSCRTADTRTLDFRSQVLRSVSGQTESKILFG